MKIKRLVLVLPLVLYSGVIYYLSDQSTVPFVDLGFWNWDKIVHFSAYFIYGIFLQIAIFTIDKKSTKKYDKIVVILLGLLFGFSDEFHQSFVVGRNASLGDWVADSLGVIVSLSLHKRLKNNIFRFIEKLRI